MAVKIELNSAGVRELLKSPEILSACQEAADSVNQKAGGGYSTSAYTGRTRVNVSVYTDDPERIRDNLENNTLLKCL